MQLTREDGLLFQKLYSALAFYAAERLTVLDEPVADAKAYEALPPGSRAKVRNALHAKPDLIDQFIQENPADLTAEELGIVSGWRHALVGTFYAFRHLKRYTVFLSSGNPTRAYGVLSPADSFQELIGPRLPLLTETALLPFRDGIVCDGLVCAHGMPVAPGVRRSLNARYKRAKEAFGIITSVATGDKPAPASKGKPKKRETPKIRRRLEEVFQSILCPVAGSSCLHGAETTYYYDHGSERHVLEVRPAGLQEIEEREGDGRKNQQGEARCELAEFDFTELKDLPLEYFHFSRRQEVFAIGWKESAQDLELRIHIEPAIEPAAADEGWFDLEHSQTASPSAQAMAPPNEEDSRIRAVFAISSDASIPRVSRERLLEYRAFLVAGLSFPFQALCAETAPPARQPFRYVTVIGLSDTPHRADGLLCILRSPQGEIEVPLAELGVREGDSNHQLVDDYAYWFWNWR